MSRSIGGMTVCAVVCALAAAVPARAAETVEGDWRFGENGGQVLFDATANDNDLIRGSTAAGDVHDPGWSSDTPQPAGGNYSLSLDGTNDFAHLPSLPASLKPTDEFTLASWVKLHSLDLGDQDVVIASIEGWGESGGYQLLFGGGDTPGAVMFYRDASFTDRAISVPLSQVGWEADTWYHLAGTYADAGSDADLELYVDGRLVQSGRRTGNISYGNTDSFHVGTNYDGAGGINILDRELNGKLDATQVWDGRLEPGEVRDLAQITQSWTSGVSGVLTDKARWQIAKVPAYASNLRLPAHGADYTVAVTQPCEVYSLTVQNRATARLDGNGLSVGKDTDIQPGGTLHVDGATYAQAAGTVLDVGGTLRLTGGEVDANVTVQPGGMVVGSGSVTNSHTTGRTENHGQLVAEGGGLTVYGTTVNHGRIGTDGNGIAFSTLDNRADGLVEARGGLAAGSIVNEGTVNVRDDGVRSRLTLKGSMSGGGRFGLEGVSAAISGDLALTETGCLDDYGTEGQITVRGHVQKLAGAADAFDADQIALTVCDSLMVKLPGPHQFDWRAEDRGAVEEGMPDNLALGELIFGEGKGPIKKGLEPLEAPAGPTKDEYNYKLTPETIVYTYGLVISSDAAVDLGGATIYYVEDGFEINGIPGTGFYDSGTWANGRILPIPEPATLALLAFWSAACLAGRRRR